MIKCKKTLYIELILIFYWCAFLTKSDSYIVPYILVGMIGVCFCITRALKGDFDSENKKSKKENVLTNLYAIVLAFAVTLANYNFFTDLSGDGFIVCRKVIEAILIFSGSIMLFKEILQGVIHLKAIPADAACLKNEKLIFGVLWGILVLEYAVVLFDSQNPGVLTPDSISQMTQLLTNSYSNHHPYYHTQMIHVMISLGLWLFGDINKAVALYSMFSIVVMSSCFIYVVETIYKQERNRKVAMAIFLFYLVMPFHIIYSITMWKDVFWGAAVTCFAVSCYRCLKSIGSSKFNITVLILASVGMALLRSNGWIAFFLSTTVFAILFGKKQKKLFLLFIMVLISTYVLKHPVLKMLQVSQPDTVESLSIPVQQIARVIADGKELTEEQKQILEQVMDIEKIPEKYKSYISDPIKELVREKNQNYIKEHALDFVKVYLQLGIKYPHKYIEAWIDQTKGYWNSGYSYWRWTTGVRENTLGIYQNVKSQWINRAVEKYLEVWESSPFLQIFISIGLFVWGIGIVSYRALIKKNKAAFFIAIPFLAVILTLLVATPVYSEFRYAYAIFCGFPFVLATSFE